MSLLHCLVAGVTANFRVAFGGRRDKDDRLEFHIGGFNPDSLHSLYEPSMLHDEASSTFASIPQIESVADDLLLFPDELERRVRTGLSIAEKIRAHLNRMGRCRLNRIHTRTPINMYARRCRLYCAPLPFQFFTQLNRVQRRICLHTHVVMDSPRPSCSFTNGRSWKKHGKCS